MRPDHRTAGIAIGRFNDVRPADLLVALGSEPGDDQITLFIEQEKTVLILDNEGVGPARFLAVGGGGAEGFPKPLSAGGLEAAQLAVAANAVDISVLQERRAQGAVQSVGILFAHALALPNQIG